MERLLTTHWALVLPTRRVQRVCKPDEVESEQR